MTDTLALTSDQLRLIAAIRAGDLTACVPLGDAIAEYPATSLAAVLGELMRPREVAEWADVTDAELAGWERSAANEGLTKSPWFSHGWGMGCSVVSGTSVRDHGDEIAHDVTWANCQHIAAMHPGNALRLIGLVRRLAARVGELEREVERLLPNDSPDDDVPEERQNRPGVARTMRLFDQVQREYSPTPAVRVGQRWVRTYGGENVLTEVVREGWLSVVTRDHGGEIQGWTRGDFFRLHRPAAVTPVVGKWYRRDDLDGNWCVVEPHDPAPGRVLLTTSPTNMKGVDESVTSDWFATHCREASP